MRFSKTLLKRLSFLLYLPFNFHPYQKPLALEKDEKWLQAYDAWLEVRKYDLGSPRPDRHIAKCLMRSGRQKDALIAAREGLKRWPGDEFLAERELIILLNSNDISGLCAWLEKLPQTAPPLDRLYVRTLQWLSRKMTVEGSERLFKLLGEKEIATHRKEYFEALMFEVQVLSRKQNLKLGELDKQNDIASDQKILEECRKVWCTLHDRTDSVFEKFKCLIYSAAIDGKDLDLTRYLQTTDDLIELLQAFSETIFVLRQENKFSAIEQIYAEIDAFASTSLVLSKKQSNQILRHLDQIARDAFKEHDFVNAKRFCHVALKLDPNNVQATVLLARSHFQVEEFSEAQRALNVLLEQSPTDFKLLDETFKILYASGQHEKARDQLEIIRQNNVFNLVDYAKLAASAGLYGHVGDVYEKYIREVSDDRKTLTNYIKFLDQSWQWGKIIKLDEDYPNLDLQSTNGSVRNAEDLLHLSGDARQFIIDNPDEFLSNSKAFELLITDQNLATPHISKHSSTYRKRLAIVISTLGPGGAERQCSLLARSINALKEDCAIESVKVFCKNLRRRARDRFYLRELLDSGVDVEEFYDRNTFLSEQHTAERYLQPQARQQTIFQLRQAMWKFQPDVIHGWLDDTSINCCLVGQQLGGVRSIGRWGSFPPTMNRQSSQRSLLQARFTQQAYKSILKNSPNAQFYANSKLAANAYAEWLGREPGFFGVIHNGIDFDRFSFSKASRAALRKKLGISDDTVLVGTAIRFTEEKRPDMWLQIADLVATQNPNVEFVLIGEGPLSDVVSTMVKNLKTAKVHLVGRQSNMNEWFSAFDIVTMTSSVEGISNTIIEAQSLYNPVVVFDVGGMSEAVKADETGFLVEDLDLNQYVNVLSDLIRDQSLRRQMGENAHQFAKDEFSVEAMMRRTLDIYRGNINEMN